MIRRLVGGVFTAAALVAGSIAPAHATPQCRYGDNVTADCAGGQCPDVTTGQAAPCLGMVLDPMLPPGPPVRVGLEGGIGFGIG